MRSGFLLLLLLLLNASNLLSEEKNNDTWLTLYEQSGRKRTPRYSETIEYCKRLAKASTWVKYTSFGLSPQGRDLPLVILSKDRACTPAEAAKTQKAVILIQSGIHAGEIDGKDASLMLMRDIAVSNKLGSLLDNTILLFVPIFNVDGHERFGAYNRINQNGPDSMGWRATGQNLNLNRDYLKADTPEMRAMLRLFSAWLPDFYVDCHVTDGIDFQYDVTYAIDTGPNVEPPIAGWLKSTLLPGMLPKVEASGHKIFSYVFPREDNDLGKGLTGGGTPPRFSTGYGPLQNRPSFLVETHMLKPYETRVHATYELLKALIETINDRPGLLRNAVRRADQLTIAAAGKQSKFIPLRLGLGRGSEEVRFLGITSRTEHSDISGAERRIYTGEPMEIKVPFFDDVTVTDSASTPFAYLVPQEWTFVPEVMRLHGVKLERLAEAAELEVESYKFSDVQFRERPYEGRQTATCKTELIRERRSYPSGTLLIRTNQRAGKVVMHLLEPHGPDSFLAWGFFNAIFEQKEYAENYVMEDAARAMLTGNPILKKQFEEKVTSDTAFARSPDARLNWLYMRSKWADPWLNKYPVGRVIVPVLFKTANLKN